MREGISIQWLCLTIVSIISVSSLEWNEDSFSRQVIVKSAIACDFPGSDINKIQTSTGLQCGESCVNNEYCTHFTWNSGACFIKRYYYPVEPKYFSGCISGWIDRNNNEGSSAVNSSMDCFYKSTDFMQTTSNTSDECKNNCTSNEKCIYFAWVNGNCYMMPSETVLDLKNVICGSVDRRPKYEPAAKCLPNCNNPSGSSIVAGTENQAGVGSLEIPTPTTENPSAVHHQRRLVAHSLAEKLVGKRGF